MKLQMRPQPPPLFNYTPDSLTARTEEILTRHKEVADAIVRNVSVQTAEFSNVLLPLAHARSEMFLDINIIEFLRSVSPDSKIRAASVKASKKNSDYLIDLSTREDVFRLVQTIYRQQRDDVLLDAESRYLLEKYYKDFMRMGLDLPATQRNRLKTIKKRLPELYIAFSKKLGEEKGGLWFAPDELRGVPGDIPKTFEVGQQGGDNEGKLRMTFKSPDLDPVLRHCQVAETRKKV